MTICHHKLLIRVGSILGNGWTHPSSKTIFVNLFIQNLTKNIASVMLNVIFSVVVVLVEEWLWPKFWSLLKLNVWPYLVKQAIQFLEDVLLPSNYMMVSFQRNESAIKKIMIIYSCSSKSLEFTSCVLPINEKSWNQRKNYAHVIHGPRKRNQRVV